MSSYIGNKKIEKIFVGVDEVSAIFNGTNKIYSGVPEANQTLENNTWKTIRAVCEAGEAANYWAIGDTKTDVGIDGLTRTFQIVDMKGIYSNKHVVFQQVELESTAYQMDSNQSNLDFSTSDLRLTHLPTILEKYSDDLKSNITNTTYPIALEGTTQTNLTDKLIVPALKLIGMQGGEFWEKYAYWYYHTQVSEHIKYVNGTASRWWTSTVANEYDSTKYWCISKTGYASFAKPDEYLNLSIVFSF